MLAKLKTFSLLGIDALPVEVEVDVSPSGLPKMVLVGLPEAAVKESTYRVERAIVNSSFQRPQSRVIINLAPHVPIYDNGKGMRFPGAWHDPQPALRVLSMNVGFIGIGRKADIRCEPLFGGFYVILTV